MPGDKTPQVSVKTELPYKRLPSFKTPRDLKLSEFREVHTNPLSETRTKRVFVPNLNIQRKKTDEKDAAQKYDKKEPEKKEEKFRPRLKKTKDLIQSSGVFSEGLAPTVKSSGWKSKNTDATPTTSVPRPKLKSLNSLKVNKEENDELMKELLRDDFINDPDLEPDASYAPIQLPLQQCSLNEEKPKLNLPNGIKIKDEPDPEFEDERLFSKCETKPVDITHMRPFSMADVLSIDQKFLFFQLPTCLPQLQLNLAQIPKKNTTEDSDCFLKSLPQGQIGKLQQLRSGKIRLVLGGVKMDIEPGIQPTFKEDLISATLNEDTKTGNLVNLGSVATKMLVTPNWETVIKS